MGDTFDRRRARVDFVSARIAELAVAQTAPTKWPDHEIRGGAWAAHAEQSPLLSSAAQIAPVVPPDLADLLDEWLELLRQADAVGVEASERASEAATQTRSEFLVAAKSWVVFQRLPLAERVTWATLRRMIDQPSAVNEARSAEYDLAIAEGLSARAAARRQMKLGRRLRRRIRRRGREVQAAALVGPSLHGATNSRLGSEARLFRRMLRWLPLWFVCPLVVVVAGVPILLSVNGTVDLGWALPVLVALVLFALVTLTWTLFASAVEFYRVYRREASGG